MKEKQADVSGTKICPSCKGSGQNTTITAFTGVCGNCNGTGKVAADVSIEQLAEKSWRKGMGVKENFSVNPFYSMGFKAGYAAANQPQPHESIGQVKILVHVLEKIKGWCPVGSSFEKEITNGLKAAAAKDGQAERMFSLKEMIGAMIEGEAIGDYNNVIKRKQMRQQYFKEKFNIEL